jgi:hypothetical protein
LECFVDLAGDGTGRQASAEHACTLDGHGCNGASVGVEADGSQDQPFASICSIWVKTRWEYGEVSFHMLLFMSDLLKFFEFWILDFGFCKRPSGGKAAGGGGQDPWDQDPIRGTKIRDHDPWDQDP